MKNLQTCFAFISRRLFAVQRREMNRIIRLVSFDVTGTLVKPAYTVGRQYAEAAEKYLGVKYDEETLQKSFIKNYREKLKLYPCFGALHQISTTQWWFSVFSKCISENGLTVGATDLEPPYTKAQLFQAFEHIFSNFKWKLLPGTEETLKSFRSMKCGNGNRMKVAAISNSDERTSMILLEHGILKYFDTSVSSVEAKCEKPDPRIFELALKKLDMSDINNNQILHVGNMHRNDYLGAINLGMHALLLRDIDDGNKDKDLVHDSHSITNISEVLSYVEKYNSRFLNL